MSPTVSRGFSLESGNKMCFLWKGDAKKINKELFDAEQQYNGVLEELKQIREEASLKLKLKPRDIAHMKQVYNEFMYKNIEWIYKSIDIEMNYIRLLESQ